MLAIVTPTRPVLSALWLLFYYRFVYDGLATTGDFSLKICCQNPLHTVEDDELKYIQTVRLVGIT